MSRDRSGRLSFATDGRDWPNRGASRFVEAGGLRWHVQVMGQGPTMLLLHGTGAATHSWRALGPLLAHDFTLVAPDLPGHGFTDPLPAGRVSLPDMARALGRLLGVLAVAPEIIVGHSAGAALAVRMRLDGLVAPKVIVGLNAALLPFEGFAGHLFPSIARLLFVNPIAARLFAWSADRTTVARLLAGTGSTIDRTGLDLYARLIGNPRHVAGVLAMMANWDLDRLYGDMKRLDTPLVLIAATDDKAVPFEAARRAERQGPGTEVVTVRGLGHLAHEEEPGRLAGLIRDIGLRHGLLSSA